ncbi:MAG: hypothetical protein JOS17DRAFT_142874 [Linnemannia elongata]|nr:MAG: hypothetical protein JOS17DRAFT_142874 [Linnemannia elongata]
MTPSQSPLPSPRPLSLPCLSFSSKMQLRFGWVSCTGFGSAFFFIHLRQPKITYQPFSSFPSWRPSPHCYSSILCVLFQLLALVCLRIRYLSPVWYHSRGQEQKTLDATIAGFTFQSMEVGLTDNAGTGGGRTGKR